MSTADDLSRLADLHRSGALTDAEYARAKARVPAIYDKGKAALIVIEVESRLENGDKLFTNRFGIFARGERD